MGIGPLAFGAPWVCVLFAVVPVLWWLLRLLPPTPKKVVFPALELLRDLTATQQMPARTPWWLLLLRILVAILIILALADPLINPQPLTTGLGPALLVIDNDWASARAWDARKQAMHRFIEQAERENREVILLPTALPDTGEPLQLIGPMAAKAAYSIADHLAPMPWPAGWNEAKGLLGKLNPTEIAYSLWLNSGLGGSNANGLFKTLASYGLGKSLQVLSDTNVPLYVLTVPKNGDDDHSLTVTRTGPTDPVSVTVVARGTEGQTLAQVEIPFAKDAPSVHVELKLPLKEQNELTRLEIEGLRTAASTVLLDNDWQRHAVGLIGEKSEESAHSLLSDLFYIDRALKPFADVMVGPLDHLLKEDRAVLVLTDSTQLGDEDLTHLSEWIKKGGIFLCFAGDRLASTTNPHEADILPVGLRTGDRAMGGAMSWAVPQTLSSFSVTSPFQGLTIPPDVTISRQILAEPGSDVADRTWASLKDGTPLVTARPIGRGLSVLFHVPARSDWSNLPLSGLFVDMLRRVVDLSATSKKGDNNFQSLVPQKVLDAFGDEQQPGLTVRPLNVEDIGHSDVGPQHPPGMYGNDNIRRALNLGASLSSPEELRDIDIEPYQFVDNEVRLQPLLLVTAFILFFGDFLLSLYVRGLLVRKTTLQNLSLSVLVSAGIFLSGITSAHAARDVAAAIDLSGKTYLAYVKTGNAEIDHVSAAGLNGLAQVLERRTSLDEIGVTSIDLETDEIVFFPLIYWPLSISNPPLSQQAAQRVNDYLRHGGMIIFDSGFSDASLPLAVMKTRLSGLDIPPLVAIPDTHVLRRTFYLLDQFPGRNAGGELWLEPEELSTYDGVSSVIAGNGNWAGAWAIDKNGQPLYPCTPGGEPQREYAYRFGINVVMYALTGNYKSDQVHAQALLEKRGR